MVNNIQSKLYLIFIIIITFLAYSCAPKSRTITPLTQSNRSKIKKIAVVVNVDEEFNVSVEEYGSSPSSFYPHDIMIHLIIDSITVHYLNEKHEEILESKLIQFLPDELISDRLKHYLESSNAGFTAEISKVKSPSILKAKGFDTILEVNLKEWGIVRCKATFPIFGKKVKVEKYHRSSFWSGEWIKPKIVRARIKLSGRMISIEDSSTVWEREELYMDETCYYLVDLKSQPELLVDMLTRAIQNLAENTVNEVL